MRGFNDDELIALVCDGRRTGIDVGLTLAELAALMADVGARHAVNLDGGASTAPIHHGHLLNRPYDAKTDEQRLPPGRDSRELKPRRQPVHAPPALRLGSAVLDQVVVSPRA